MHNTPISLPDRSLDTLTTLRAETRRRIEPAVARILKQDKVQIETNKIDGITCLHIYPSEITAEWKILYGFGGGFVSGSPFEDLTIAAPLSISTGSVVIIPHYRLAPEFPWPAAIDDGFAVYKALSNEPFAIVGESAGGNLCLVLMQLAKRAGIPLPGAAAFLSPWCDLANSGSSLEDNNGRDPALTKQHLYFAAEHYAGAHDLADPAISPINGISDSSFPPCLITSGTRDLLMSQSERLAEILTHQGVRVDLRIWEDLWHVFEWDNELPEAKKSISEVSKFLIDNMFHRLTNSAE